MYKTAHYSRNTPLFPSTETLLSNDVQQGALGDCWVLSSMSSVAGHYGLVEMRKRIKEVGVDIYAVKLFSDGALKTIVVDGSFPYDSRRKRFLYGHSESDTKWVSVFEKAVAELAGGYDKLDGGDPKDALYWMTGSRADVYSLNFRSLKALHNLKVC